MPDVFGGRGAGETLPRLETMKQTIMLESILLN